MKRFKFDNKNRKSVNPPQFSIFFFLEIIYISFFLPSFLPSYIGFSFFTYPYLVILQQTHTQTHVFKIFLHTHANIHTSTHTHTRVSHAELFPSVFIDIVATEIFWHSLQLVAVTTCAKSLARRLVSSSSPAGKGQTRVPIIIFRTLTEPR